MTQPGKNKKVLILKGSGYAVVGSIILIADQVRRIRRGIGQATSTDVLSIEQIQPSYICIEDPRIQEQIEAGNLLTKERLKLTRIHRWVNDKIEGSFMFQNLHSLKQNQAWKYLRLAKDGNRSYRLRAVKSLAALNDLSDADYQELAQSMDMRTAVGLARTTSNIKFFLDPPYFKQKPDRNAIVKNFHDFLRAIDSNGNHPCLQYFISKVFSDVPETGFKSFDDDLSVKVSHNDYIPWCVEALLHHSWIGSNAKEIVTLGGLPLLTEVYKYLIHEDPENVEGFIMLSRLISNMSVYENCMENFFVCGWIKLLAILSQHPDIRVSAPAQRALINFDTDDTSCGEAVKYHRRIYPLYPTERTSSQAKVDVIFIHGLLGGVFVTWRQRDAPHGSHKSPFELLVTRKQSKVSSKGIVCSEREKETLYARRGSLESDFFVDMEDVTGYDNIEKDYKMVLADIPVDANTVTSGPYFCSRQMQKECRDPGFSKCWPKDWLSRDCPDTRIIGVNYETNISLWTPMCPTISASLTLAERSTQIMQALSKAGVGRRPIVWVGHSMGGLIVKDILIQAYESEDREKRAFYENTKGIVFYSTPHKGSHLAALNTTSQMIIWPSIEVQELRENSPALLQRHSKFLDIVRRHPMKIVTFAERESTYITSMKFEIRFVNPASADPDVGEMYGIPLDHLSICKPACKQSFLYQKVLKLIREVLKESTGTVYES